MKRQRLESSMTNAFFPILDRVRAQVDRQLESLFDARRAGWQHLGADVVAMVDAVADLTMRGGKRSRPALLYCAYRGVDERAPEDVAIGAGVALELLQSYLLIHDDWMDHDEVRRGGPSTHVVLARHFGSRTLGEASAILAGDFGSAFAVEVLAAQNAPPERMGPALRLFAQFHADTIAGQQIDLAGRRDDVEQMHDLKTGSYTVRGPLLLGATLAGASNAQLQQLRAFARPLGIAFQLRDDLLGAYGDAAQTGKPVGSDIRSGKPTSLLAEAMRRASETDRRTLAHVSGRADAPDGEVAEVVAIYERSGARAAVERRQMELVAEARGALASMEFAEQPRSWLEGAAAALTARDH